MRTKRTLTGALVPALIASLLAVAVQPAYGNAGADDPHRITFTNSDGATYTVRALLPEEIRARGLNKDAPQAELRVIAPRFIDSRHIKALPPPARKPSTEVSS
jgi:hypothetical protein